jgi:hypothetical protein
MGVESWGALLIAVLLLAAVAARILWVADWFPPPYHWSLKRKLLVWAVFVTGMVGLVVFVIIVWRR